MAEGWQDRLKAEREELVGRMEKLYTFISSPEHGDLDPIDQELLSDQYDSMDRYRQALDLRIARLSKEE